MKKKTPTKKRNIYTTGDLIIRYLPGDSLESYVARTGISYKIIQRLFGGWHGLKYQAQLRLMGTIQPPATDSTTTYILPDSVFIKRK